MSKRLAIRSGWVALAIAMSIALIWCGSMTAMTG